MDKTLEPIFKSFGNTFYAYMSGINEEINEIRIRSDKPIIIYASGKPYIAVKSGLLPLGSIGRSEEVLSITFQSLRKAFEKLCEFSVYKYQNDINNGFITLDGGHRVGLCGTAVSSSLDIKSVIDITALNIRVAREYLGCSDIFLDRVEPCGGILICGVPSTGKTTLLRDISRKLSIDFCKKISVVDERCEISSMINGRSMFDMGLCDIYCGYPKEKAIIQAIRTMSPDYIVCDELTGNDLESVKQTVNYGVGLIASVHCDCIGNALKNPSIVNLLNTRAFRKIVFLKSDCFGVIDEIYDLEELALD